MAEELVTMFTDAGLKLRKKTAVWAMWAKHNGITYTRSGWVKGKVTHIGYAELAAIANGLYVMSTKLPKIDRVIIQSDSLEAIGAIQKNYHKHPEAQAVAEHITSFAAMKGWKLDLRHVKAHRPAVARGRRETVNHWCDRECKRLIGVIS